MSTYCRRRNRSHPRCDAVEVAHVVAAAPRRHRAGIALLIPPLLISIHVAIPLQSLCTHFAHLLTISLIDLMGLVYGARAAAAHTLIGSRRCRSSKSC